MKKPSLLIIWLTVFIDLIGFGIVVPLIPLFSKDIGAHGLLIGVIISSFSAMQFIFAPIWGRLSDRIGRRPVLLGSTFGAAISYVLFGIACGLKDPKLGLGLMIVSRVFAGICGGNITVAQAYIADITPPDQRSKKMGLIGMAFGLGFIFGPIIGGVSWQGISLFGKTIQGLGPMAPGFVAAGLCAANFILALCVLTESRQPTSEPVAQRPHLNQWVHTLTHPKIGLLVIVFFFATFCFSCFESTLGLLIIENFNLDIAESTKTSVKLFVFCGLISATVQGGMIGRLVKKFGEIKLITISLIFTAASLAVIPFIKGNAELTGGILLSGPGLPWIFMLLALALLAIGTSLTRPPLFGLLSNLTSANEQGATIGVAQSAGSLARILGPIFATTTLHYVPALPYLVGTILLLITAVLFANRFRRQV